MKFRFDVDVKEALSDLTAAGKVAQEAVNKEMARTALAIESEAKRRIQRAPATGAYYTRGGVTHQASAAGEYPKTDTGNLFASIGAIQQRPENGLDVWLVGSPLVYGEYLEYGTMNMRPRPWLIPTMRWAVKDHNKRITEAVRKASNNAT